MALLSKVTLKTGEEKELYLRINNIEASNHGEQSYALVRGFISEEAFNKGYHYAHEEEISFTADVTLPLWDQAYSVLKGLYPESIDA